MHTNYVPDKQLWRLRRDVAELLRADFTAGQRLRSAGRLQRLLGTIDLNSFT